MRVMDLQLFSEEEKREAPTPRKRQKARRRGQVMRSQELTAGVMLVITFLMIRGAGGWMLSQMESLFRETYGRFVGPDLTAEAAAEILGVAAAKTLLALSPLLLIVMVVGVAVTSAQVGLAFTPEPLTPRLDRLDPGRGFKRLVSVRAMVELGKGVLKLGVLGTVMYFTLMPIMENLPSLVDQPLTLGLAQVGESFFGLAIRASLVLLGLGVLDVVYQHWEHERSLKMSHREMKEEHRDTEGDPISRQRRRERAREMSRARMLTDVPASDVVITNPVEYAIALRYDPEAMAVPVVTARGRGFLASRIRDLAWAHGVTMVENRPLARLLYDHTDMGDPVPPEVYQTVAEILAFVWRVEGRRLA